MRSWGYETDDPFLHNISSNWGKIRTNTENHLTRLHGSTLKVWMDCVGGVNQPTTLSLPPQNRLSWAVTIVVTEKFGTKWETRHEVMFYYQENTDNAKYNCQAQP